MTEPQMTAEISSEKSSNRSSERSSNDKGKHSELLAQTALLANGWSVLEPISPQPYDLAARCPLTGEIIYVQVKTAYIRDSDKDVERYGKAYLRVPGARNNGRKYETGEVDYFIAVWQGECYMFRNREKTEYWVLPEEIGDKWDRLSMEIVGERVT